MSRFVSFSLLATLLLTYIAGAQNVTTWHNDNNRTGWQQYETVLTPSVVGGNNTFGLLWQWQLPAVTNPQVPDQAFAQPLAMVSLNGVGTGCPTSCNVVFVATEQDMLYAFNADSSSQTPLCGANLASNVGGAVPVDCTAHNPPCPMGLIYPYVGVTGTPVISTSGNGNANPNILYVVSAVLLAHSPWDPQYYLHAIDIKTGLEKTGSPLQISPSANGIVPMSACATGVGTAEPIAFDPGHHFQRTGLLLLTLTTGGISADYVYVAFTPVGDQEMKNGWIVSYTYGATGLAPVDSFITTPNGTGGGVWEAGAGLASDGTYIYAPTGNGTFDASTGGSDYGDSLIKLDASSLMESDYFTPTDFSARCSGDLDFSSGGVLLLPDQISSNYPPHLMVSAEKESYLWVLNRDSLGGLGGSGLVEQSLQTDGAPGGAMPGYWSSAAYWKYASGNTTNFQIYYAADDPDTIVSQPPLPLAVYTLNPSPPIITTASYHTSTLFCGNPHAPTASISTNSGTQSTGILWAIESTNPGNPPGAMKPNCDLLPGSAVLHAYDPITLAEYYNSGDVAAHVANGVGRATNFGVPTIFNGKVYVGTKQEIDVFGPCSVSPGTCIP